MYPLPREHMLVQQLGHRRPVASDIVNTTSTSNEIRTGFADLSVIERVPK